MPGSASKDEKMPSDGERAASATDDAEQAAQSIKQEDQSEPPRDSEAEANGDSAMANAEDGAAEEQNEEEQAVAASGDAAEAEQAVDDDAQEAEEGTASAAGNAEEGDDGDDAVSTTSENQTGKRKRSRSRDARHRSASSTIKELAALGLGAIGDGEIISGPRRRRKQPGTGNGTAGGNTKRGRGGSGRSQSSAEEEGQPQEGMAEDHQGEGNAQESAGEPSAVRPAEGEAMKSGEQAVGGDMEDEGVTRCICGSEEETLGLMIQCETCRCWQHCICMGLHTEEDCPDVYFCEQCEPELHINLLRALGFLAPPRSHKKGASTGKSHSRAALARELNHAKQAVAVMAAENAKRLKQHDEWTAREAAHQFAAARKSGRAPHSVLDVEDPATSGPGSSDNPSQVAPVPGQYGELSRRQRSTSKINDEEKTPNASGSGTNAIYGFPSAVTPRSPKRRSTLNSRDRDNGGWEAIPPGLLDEGEGWNGHAPADSNDPESGQLENEDMEERDKKRKRDATAEEEQNGESPQPEEEEDSGDAAKRRKTDDETMQAPRSSSGKGKGSKSKHPNQYTYRNKDKAGNLGVGGNALGLSQSASSSPSPTKSRGRSRVDGGGSINGTPSPATPALLWGLPDHLSHLDSCLPSSHPEELLIRVPSTKGVTAKNQANDPNPPDTAASPQPFQYLELSEPCTKIRFPGRRTTMGEMRKRVRNIGEYVMQMQVEAVERDRRREKLGIALPSSSAASETRRSSSGDGGNGMDKEGAAGDGDAEMGDVTAAADEEAEHAAGESTAEAGGTPAPAGQPSATAGEGTSHSPTDKPTSNSNSDDLPTAMQMLDDMSRDLTAFQQKFGMAPGAAGMFQAQIMAARGMTPAAEEEGMMVLERRVRA